MCVVSVCKREKEKKKEKKREREEKRREREEEKIIFKICCERQKKIKKKN